MKSKLTEDHWLALFFLAAALLVIFLWVPMDTGSGLVEKVRRKFVIGDALGPTVAGAIIALGAGLIWVRPATGASLNRANIRWIAALLVLFGVSLAAMRYTGPVVAAGMEGGYRPLRATPPWNYLGFVLGGTVLIGALTGISTRRWSIRDFIVGFIASMIIALLYDLPFDDLILPPNGDV